MSNKQRLVVIGNGMAGARTVEEILLRGGAEQFEITMFGDEPYGNYNRILLSNVLNGSQGAHDIFLNPLAWYRENDIQLHAGVRVTEIDRANKRVIATRSENHNGPAPKFGRNGEESVPYDKLIIATGSRPFVPRIENLHDVNGKLRPGIFVFRTVDDCTKIAGYATKVRSAAVIGGGLLGLEAARGLIRFGIEVHVIHLAPTLMENQLDATAGRMLRQTMEKMGVKVHTEKATSDLLLDEDGENVTGLRFKDGSELRCDMVIVSCGITPNAEIGKTSGLTVNRAIVVDDHMRSVDDPDIYVVGECAEHNGRVYGLVAPLWEQGELRDETSTHATSVPSLRRNSK